MVSSLMPTDTSVLQLVVLGAPMKMKGYTLIVKFWWFLIFEYTLKSISKKTMLTRSCNNINADTPM